MANNLLPARTGELVRAWAAGRLTAVRFSSALASIALERFTDFVAILGLLGLALVTGGWPASVPESIQSGVELVLVAGAVGTALFTVASTMPSPAGWLRRVLENLGG